ncbi:conserved hypothetical protein [Sporisorium reilianum SRZ2]|uniref:DUF676 domain-containing protein n=1 Tax=Sporisorium reilianum (strain SRZ2) TaxID=999809 RepID=E6ZTX0_SPORE|nr:conserved hypothetical protein [Sporisorium reilianum SRZ2]
MSTPIPTDELNPWASQTLPPPPQPGSSLSNAIVVDDPPERELDSKQQGFSQSAHPPAPDVRSTGMEGRDQLLLLVFIHGFKGSSETTFEDFPSRLTYNLQETYPGLHVKSLVYPTYDTRGSLAVAVESFVEWLTEQTVMLESKPEIDPATGDIVADSGKGGGMGSVKIVLAGHSMGGLVAVDAALAIAHSSADQQANTPPEKRSSLKLWPRVVGVLAFDTPYYGVHPGVFKHGINKYAGYLQTAQTIGTFFAPMGVGLAARWNSERQQSQSQARSTSSNSTTAPARSSSADDSAASSARATSNWRTALMATGAVALASGAAASAAYFNKDKLNGAYGWVTDHLAFVSNLWDDNALRLRLDRLVDQPQILFHCYYTRLPSTSRAANPNADAAAPPRDRTFIILPPRAARCAGSFTPMDNTRACDEVDAHVSMFSARGNPRYFELGLRTSGLIAVCLDNECRFGDQVLAQREAEQAVGVDEQSGLRDGDAELEAMKQQAGAG